MAQRNPTPRFPCRTTIGPWTTGLALALALAGSPISGATAEDEGLCAQELEAVCGDLQDRRERYACARENRERLSAQCRVSSFERARRHRGQADPRRACFDDARTLCGEAVEQGSREQVAACLEEQMEQLSGACRTALETRSEHGPGEGCRDEVVQLCPDAVDRTAMRQCLVQNRAQLSEECRDRIRDGRAGRL